MKIIATILIFALCNISLAWNVETHTDEMTDTRQYVIWTTGTVVQITSILDYTPQFQVRLTSPTYQPDTDNIRAKIELLFTIEVDGLNRSGAEILYRIDEQEPVSEIWMPATDRRGAFSPYSIQLLGKLKSANTLRIRYITTLGHIRTVRFSLQGLGDAIKKAIGQEREHYQKGHEQSSSEPRDDPALVEARKAKAARAYSKPLPDIREEIAKRTREHAEEKLNPKRLTLLRLQRRTHKVGTVWIQHFIADGKKWRTGFLESGGVLSQIDPKTLKSYIDASTPED